MAFTCATSMAARCCSRKDTRRSKRSSSMQLLSWTKGNSGLFRLPISFPQGEHVALRILANGEIAHLWHGGLWLVDLSPKFLHLHHSSCHGLDRDVVRDRVLRTHPRHQGSIGRGVVSAGVDMPVIFHCGKWVDFPPE